MLNEGNSPIDLLPEYTRKFLKQTPHLLRSFHYEDVHAFLNMGKEEKYDNGDVIVPEGESLGAAYLIAEGNVSLWKENIQLVNLSEGDFIGETFLFSRIQTEAKVQSDKQTIVLKFERHDVLNYFRKKPGKLFNIFTKNIIEIQQEKIFNMNIQLIKLKKRLLDQDTW